MTPQHISVANVGDSRAILGRIIDGKFKTIVMSDDHDLSIQVERERAERAGFEVVLRENGDVKNYRYIIYFNLFFPTFL